MKTIIDTRQWSWLLWNSMILISFIAINNFLSTMAAPRPNTFSAENYDDSINFLLERQFEDERKLEEIQLEIQAVRAKLQETLQHQPVQLEYSDGELEEMLPIPSAVVQHESPREGKRQNYMTLCHFKICNLGRKRKL
ncbi:hypothetical protein PV327_007745 [Microctonus hyperodae]|uniref:Uncharacterized protein n=1 Tax=Microctonus hyperodae TaxID=165561 RepID=A0AA39FZU7_MICHY|nr:hypothetical protein PV327_007745 [Microctonus hyperodae]